MRPLFPGELLCVIILLNKEESSSFAETLEEAPRNRLFWMGINPIPDRSTLTGLPV
jgi:hypothetical protein